jgi:hypothetical protein
MLLCATRIYRLKSVFFLRFLLYKQKGSNALSFLRAKLRRRAILTPYADAFFTFQKRDYDAKNYDLGEINCSLDAGVAFLFDLKLLFWKIQTSRDYIFILSFVCAHLDYIVAAC